MLYINFFETRGESSKLRQLRQDRITTTDKLLDLTTRVPRLSASLRDTTRELTRFFSTLSLRTVHKVLQVFGVTRLEN